MAFINKKSHRSTDAYKFSIYNKNDPALVELRQLVSSENKNIRKYNASDRCVEPKTLKRVCVKPRGPRPQGYIFHTPTHLATHFDVYVSNRY